MTDTSKLLALKAMVCREAERGTSLASVNDLINTVKKYSNINKIVLTNIVAVDDVLNNQSLNQLIFLEFTNLENSYQTNALSKIQETASLSKVMALDREIVNTAINKPINGLLQCSFEPSDITENDPNALQNTIYYLRFVNLYSLSQNILSSLPFRKMLAIIAPRRNLTLKALIWSIINDQVKAQDIYSKTYLGMIRNRFSSKSLEPPTPLKHIESKAGTCELLLTELRGIYNVQDNDQLRTQVKKIADIIEKLGLTVDQIANTDTTTFKTILKAISEATTQQEKTQLLNCLNASKLTVAKPNILGDLVPLKRIASANDVRLVDANSYSKTKKKIISIPYVFSRQEVLKNAVLDYEENHPNEQKYPVANVFSTDPLLKGPQPRFVPYMLSKSNSALNAMNLSDSTKELFTVWITNPVFMDDQRNIYNPKLPVDPIPAFYTKQGNLARFNGFTDAITKVVKQPGSDQIRFTFDVESIKDENLAKKLIISVLEDLLPLQGTYAAGEATR